MLQEGEALVRIGDSLVIVKIVSMYLSSEDGRFRDGG